MNNNFLPYQIKKTNDSNEALASQLAENTSQLATNVINVKYPQAGLTGAKGDGTTDDTSSLQAILTYASQNGYDVFFPPGTYKVTAPLTLYEYYDGHDHRIYWPKISGMGWHSVANATIIKGYNIPAKRAVLELLGYENGYVTSSTVENIEIDQDIASCDPTSFCMSVGDAWFFHGKKIKMTGQNALKLRCGSASGATSYSMINVTFEQCFFNANKSLQGWAVMHEIVETGTGTGFDNIKFDSCLFQGLTMIHAITAELDNCQFSVFPRQNVVNYTSGILNNYSVDFSVALWITNGEVIKVHKCYFEDYRQGIVIQPLGSAIVRYADITDNIFHAWTNYADPSNPGTNYKADRAIHILNNPNAGQGGVATVNIQSNVFTDNFLSSPTTTLFQDVIIKNEAAATLIVKNNAVDQLAASLRMTDTASTRFDIDDAFMNRMGKTMTLEFEIPSFANANNHGNLVGFTHQQFPMPFNAWIKSIAVVSNKTFATTRIDLYLYKNNASLSSVNLMDSTKIDSSFTGTSGQISVVQSQLPIGQTTNHFAKGDTLGVALLATSGYNSTDAGAYVRLKVEVAY